MEQLIATALRAFHIHDDPKHYVVTDFYGMYGMKQQQKMGSLGVILTIFYTVSDANEKELAEFMPVQTLSKREGKRPIIFVRFRPPNNAQGTIRVYPGKLKYDFIIRY